MIMQHVIAPDMAISEVSEKESKIEKNYTPMQ
jgi:hypothetical protein